MKCHFSGKKKTKNVRSFFHNQIALALFYISLLIVNDITTLHNINKYSGSSFSLFFTTIECLPMSFGIVCETFILLAFDQQTNWTLFSCCCFGSSRFGFSFCFGMFQFIAKRIEIHANMYIRNIYAFAFSLFLFFLSNFSLCDCLMFNRLQQTRKKTEKTKSFLFLVSVSCWFESFSVHF